MVPLLTSWSTSVSGASASVAVESDDPFQVHWTASDSPETAVTSSFGRVRTTVGWMTSSVSWARPSRFSVSVASAMITTVPTSSRVVVSDGPVPRRAPDWLLQVTVEERSVPSEAVAAAVSDSWVPIITVVSAGWPLSVTVGPSPVSWSAFSASSADPERTTSKAASGRPACSKMSIISDGDKPGSAPKSSAATPAAWGAAIEVPFFERYPLPGHVERIDTPGAEISTAVLP